MNYLIQKWKLTRCVNLYHWFVIGIIFSYLKNFFGSIVNLHYENALFILFFHLEGNVSIKTALKFQQYYHTVNKVTYLLPKLSTVEKLISFNMASKSYIFVQIWWFLLKGNVRYRPSKMDIRLGVIPCLFKTCVFFFCVISFRRFKLLLLNIYVKFERCRNYFGKEITLKHCHNK